MNGIVAVMMCLGLGAPPNADSSGVADAMDSIRARAAARSSGMVARAWHRAAEAAERSIVEAVTILDSVRTSGAALPDSFDTDFAAFSAYGLLVVPTRRRAGMQLDPRNALTTVCDTWGRPVSTYWRLVKDADSSALPRFVFGARYDVPISARLRLRLVDSLSMRLRLELSDSVEEVLAKPLFYTPLPAPREVDIRIMVSVRGRNALDLGEYLSHVVAGAFDRVIVRDDLPGLGAVAVQCFRKSLVRGRPDEFQTYVAFDLPVPRRGNKLSESPSMPISGQADSLFVRYVVAIRGKEDVSDKAEALLRRVLAHFTTIEPS